MDWCRVLPPTSRVGSWPRVTLGFLAAQTSSGRWGVLGQASSQWQNEVLLTWREWQPVVLVGDLCIGEDQPGSLCTAADVKVGDLHCWESSWVFPGGSSGVTASTALYQLGASLSFSRRAMQLEGLLFSSIFLLVLSQTAATGNWSFWKYSDTFKALKAENRKQCMQRIGAQGGISWFRASYTHQILSQTHCLQGTAVIWPWLLNWCSLVLDTA